MANVAIILWRPNRNKQLPWMGSIHESATVQVLSVYSCPKERCMRVFQRHAALEIHLFYEQCSKEAERGTLLDQTRPGYAAKLMAGTGVMPTLHRAPDTTATRATYMLL